MGRAKVPIVLGTINRFQIVVGHAIVKPFARIPLPMKQGDGHWGPSSFPITNKSCEGSGKTRWILGYRSTQKTIDVVRDCSLAPSYGYQSCRQNGVWRNQSRRDG